MKKQRFILLLLFSVVSSSFYAENYSHYKAEFQYIHITDSQINLEYLKAEGKSLKTVDLVLTKDPVYEYEIPFIINPDTQEKYMYLISPYAAAIIAPDLSNLFDTALAPLSSKYDNFYGEYVWAQSYKASSELREKETIYSADNLKLWENGKPWVEGVDGPGIGESITMQLLNGGALLFFNGFISYDKPYLYGYNNRVREIRIYDAENTYDFNVTLEDTPLPQLVFLPCQTETVTIEIVSVYKGSKYDDTCIEMISFLTDSYSREFYQDLIKEGIVPLGYKL